MQGALFGRLFLSVGRGGLQSYAGRCVVRHQLSRSADGLYGGSQIASSGHSTKRKLSMKPADDRKVQGEGDYKSDRKYTESAHAFVKSGKVEEVARNAKPATPKDEQEMQQAEKAGESHSKGEDPALKHAPARKP